MASGSPTEDPLGYPGEIPEGPFLLDHGVVRTDGFEADLAGRIPVVAAGSNASPGRLIEKLGADAVVPVLPAPVFGIDIRASAHVTRYGSVPATCWPAPGATVIVPVTWLDPEQLAAIDGTEPNYDRIALPSEYHAYVSHRGWYQLPDGLPALLAVPGGAQGRIGRVCSQRELLTDVLSVVGDPGIATVEALITAFRDPDHDLTPTAATALLAAAGRAGTA